MNRLRADTYQNVGLGMAVGSVIAAVILNAARVTIPPASWMVFAFAVVLMLAGSILEHNEV